MHGPDGKGNLYVFAVVPLMQPFDEFVLDQLLIDELPAAQDHREVNAGIRERVIPDERFETGNPAFDRFHDRATSMVTRSTCSNFAQRVS